MKRLTAFIAFIALSPVVWVETISPVSAQASCQATVDAVSREMRQKGTGVKLGFFPGGKDGLSPMNNSRRIGTLDFYLDAGFSSEQSGSVASNILHSEVLMKSYASRIFARCGGTGEVGFGMFRTDWGHDFVMTDDGTLGYYKCANSPGELINTISSPSYLLSYSQYCAYVIPDF